MKTILFAAVFAFCSSAFADLSIFAIVKGTNVIDVLQYDTSKPPAALTNAPYSGATNVSVTADEATVVKAGWKYLNGEFRDPKGAAISNGTKARIDRAKLINAAIAELNAMQVSGANAVANWASLSAAQKDAAQKKTIDAVVTVSKILELLLLEQRALLEPNGTQQ